MAEELGAPAEPTDTHAHAAAGDRRAWLMGTRPGDWDAVEARAAGAALVRPAYGVHPWHARAAGAPEEWLPELRARLERAPHALVGEIGLDKAARDPETGKVEMAAQRAAFEAQLALAAELRRPASVHCVRCTGGMSDALRLAPALPPAVVLHSFTGAADAARQLQRAVGGRARLLFGVSAAVTLRLAAGKLPGLLGAVARSDVLLESDASAASEVAGGLAEAAAAVAEAWGVGVEEAVRQCESNAGWVGGLLSSAGVEG